MNNHNDQAHTSHTIVYFSCGRPSEISAMMLLRHAHWPLIVVILASGLIFWIWKCYLIGCIVIVLGFVIGERFWRSYVRLLEKLGILDRANVQAKTASGNGKKSKTLNGK